MDALHGGILNIISAGTYPLLFLRTLLGKFSIDTMATPIQLINMARQLATMMSFLAGAAQRAVADSWNYFRVMELMSEVHTQLELLSVTTANSGDFISMSVGSTSVNAVDDNAYRFSLNHAVEQRAIGAPIVSSDAVDFTYEEDEPVLSNVSFRAYLG